MAHILPQQTLNRLSRNDIQAMRGLLPPRSDGFIAGYSRISTANLKYGDHPNSETLVDALQYAGEVTRLCGLLDELAQANGLSPSGGRADVVRGNESNVLDDNGNTTYTPHVVIGADAARTLRQNERTLTAICDQAEQAVIARQQQLAREAQDQQRQAEERRLQDLQRQQQQLRLQEQQGIQAKAHAVAFATERGNWYVDHHSGKKPVTAVMRYSNNKLDYYQYHGLREAGFDVSQWQEGIVSAPVEMLEQAWQRRGLERTFVGHLNETRMGHGLRVIGEKARELLDKLPHPEPFDPDKTNPISISPTAARFGRGAAVVAWVEAKFEQLKATPLIETRRMEPQHLVLDADDTRIDARPQQRPPFAAGAGAIIVGFIEERWKDIRGFQPLKMLTDIKMPHLPEVHIFEQGAAADCIRGGLAIIHRVTHPQSGTPNLMESFRQEANQVGGQYGYGLFQSAQGLDYVNGTLPIVCHTMQAARPALIVGEQQSPWYQNNDGATQARLGDRRARAAVPYYDDRSNTINLVAVNPKAAKLLVRALEESGFNIAVSVDLGVNIHIGCGTCIRGGKEVPFDHNGSEAMKALKFAQLYTERLLESPVNELGRAERALRAEFEGRTRDRAA